MVLRPTPSAISLQALAKTLNLPSNGDAVITGVTHRSGDVQPGDLFIAIPGFSRHGIEHVDEAKERGAVAVATDATGLRALADFPSLTLDHPRQDMARLAAEVFGHPEQQVRLVGVTGTNGKTTVTHMIRAITREAGLSVGLIGTLGSFLNEEVIPSQRTTPEAPDLYAVLAYMVEHGAQVVVMEVSSHALELARVDGLVFEVSVFTNLSQDHLDFHGTMQNYYSAKAKLFASDKSKFGVLGIDDEWGLALADSVDIPHVTVSLDRHGSENTFGNENGHASDNRHSAGNEKFADVWIEKIEQDASGTLFQLHEHSIGETSLDLSETHRIPLIGAFNVVNAVQAVLASKELGIDQESAWNSLAHMKSVLGRMELVPVKDDISVVVDYAHTPDAVDKVLRHLRPKTPARLITVIGCGGDRDATKRPLMGQVAEQLSDVVIVTDDNPRSENPDLIRDQVSSGFRTLKPINIGDRREAIRSALLLARAGDIIAVLGKGHEQGQEIMGVTYPFCDQDVIREEAADVFSNA